MIFIREDNSLQIWAVGSGLTIPLAEQVLEGRPKGLTAHPEEPHLYVAVDAEKKESTSISLKSSDHGQIK